MADVSTAYLAESDLELLLRFDCPTRFAETDGGFGTFHWIPDDDGLFEEDMQHAVEFGLSERFVTIMRHLRGARIPYVRFDADGGEIDGISRTDIEPEAVATELSDNKRRVFQSVPPVRNGGERMRDVRTKCE